MATKELKVVLVGHPGAGKTSLLISYTEGKWPNEYIPTYFDNSEVTVVIEKEPTKVSLWDTAGEEQRFGSFRTLSYPMTDIFFICFSVVAHSLTTTTKLIHFFQTEITEKMKNDPPYYLVGMKTDLREDSGTISQCKNGESHIVTYEEGVELAKTIGAVKYMECSAKKRTNVKELFEDAYLHVVLGDAPVKI